MKKLIKKAILTIPLALTTQNSVGFELLSEGAMGNVSASTVGHSREVDTYDNDSDERYELIWKEYSP